MSGPILFHVGYYKTASTFLQRNVFGNPDSGFTAICPDEEIEPMARARHFSQKFIFGPNGQIASPWQGIDPQCRLKADKMLASKRGMPVISHERFLGYPFAAGLDAPLIRDRIHEFCPQAKILIVVREQQSLIASTYTQYLRRGGTMPIKKALTHKYDSRLAFFNREYFYYHLAVEGYMKVFGKENVLVLPYEQLKKAPEDFLSHIYTFCGLKTVPQIQTGRKENKSNSLFIEQLFRRLNLLTTRNSLNGYSPIGLSLRPRTESFKRCLSGLVPNRIEKRAKRALNESISTHLPPGTFSNSNARLSEITGIDFSSYGYR